ncbi:MAG: MmcQ/YjbR family DNA-binding protein [Deltaproteobacteria bacterium]|jgi:predicted DNA-binding protein (MmcQ/YjbR family)|nr:MmcQ/YjbR family DNA-binding protein [Deltaproteobacteria bacterium]
MKDAPGEARASRVEWPSGFLWLHEYILAKPFALEDYKESWDAYRYFVHGKIFALLVRNGNDTLLNLKCDPYLSLDYRARHPTVLPGWHMNKLHWISLSLMGETPEGACRELADISYDLVWKKLPKRKRAGESAESF